MKVPFWLKVVDSRIEDDKLVLIVKLKWWYALYTAVVSCFSARWYTEQKIEEKKDKK